VPSASNVLLGSYKKRDVALSEMGGRCVMHFLKENSTRRNKVRRRKHFTELRRTDIVMIILYLK